MASSNICKRCAERFGSCCKSQDPQQELFFPIFTKDIERVKNFKGKELSLVELKNTPNFQQVIYSLFPSKKALVLKRFPLDETHFCFKIDKSGKCHYLGDEGCLLPTGSRPAYCNLFPFWSNGKQVDYFYREECLATRNSRDLNLLYKYFNTNEEEILNLFHELEKDWGLSEQESD